jgi:hypothetical protein
MNDIARVEELRSYQILDTLPEAEFNEIVELAAAICNTPASMITFIDADHIDHQKLKEYARFFKDIAMSMDEYTQKLNDVYHLKRVQAKNKSEDDV